MCSQLVRLEWRGAGSQRALAPPTEFPYGHNGHSTRLPFWYPSSPATQLGASMVAAINMRLAELPRQEEGANKELERTKSAPAFAFARRTAALAAQFRR